MNYFESIVNAIKQQYPSLTEVIGVGRQNEDGIIYVGAEEYGGITDKKDNYAYLRFRGRDDWRHERSERQLTSVTTMRATSELRLVVVHRERDAHSFVQGLAGVLAGVFSCNAGVNLQVASIDQDRNRILREETKGDNGQWNTAVHLARIDFTLSYTYTGVACDPPDLCGGGGTIPPIPPDCPTLCDLIQEAQVVEIIECLTPEQEESIKDELCEGEDCLPISIENTQEIQLAEITECPEGGVFILPDTPLIINGTDTGDTVPVCAAVRIGIAGYNEHQIVVVPNVGVAVLLSALGTYSNGAAYQVQIASGSTFTAPQITITDVDGSTRQSVPNVGVMCEWKVLQLGASDSYVLPPSFNVTAYPTGGVLVIPDLQFEDGVPSVFGSFAYRPRVNIVNAAIAAVSTFTTFNQVTLTLIDIVNSDGLTLLSLPDFIGNKSLPDTPLTDDNGAVGSYPVPTSIVIDGEVDTASYSAGVLTIKPLGGAPSGIIYNRPAYRGQTTSYEDFDLAWQAANGAYDFGTPSGVMVSLDWASATPFYLLKDDNAFGNKYRFTDSQGVQAPDNLANFATVDWAVDRPSAVPYYVIDHFTGLGWIIVKVAFQQEWGDGAAQCLGFVEALTHGGFSDYRVPSTDEIEGVLNYQGSTQFYQSNNIFYRSNDLSATSGNEVSIWLNSTNPANTTQANILNDSGDIGRGGKSATTGRGTYAVRTHYP